MQVVELCLRVVDDLPHLSHGMTQNVSAFLLELFKLCQLLTKLFRVDM